MGTNNKRKAQPQVESYRKSRTIYPMSPPRQYLPAGAERGESNLSSSLCDEEETVEEGLAHYFSNPSYRAANPALLEPIDPEDWGDTPPVLLPLQISQ